jgi:hypothetical protein
MRAFTTKKMPRDWMDQYWIEDSEQEVYLVRGDIHVPPCDSIEGVKVEIGSEDSYCDLTPRHTQHFFVIADNPSHARLKVGQLNAQEAEGDKYFTTKWAWALAEGKDRDQILVYMLVEDADVVSTTEMVWYGNEIVHISWR